MAVTSPTWSPESWRERTALQQPEWPDAAAAAAALERLKGNPPLVFAGEARELQDSLARVLDGRAFLLQAGDCVESFNELSAIRIREKLKIMLQMSAVLTYGATLPVVKVGRIAGQFTKPRSDAFELVGGEEIPSFRGHMVNDDAPHRRGAHPRSAADGRGLQPVGRDAQPPARVHEGRLRGPDAGPHVEQGLRLELTRRAAVRAARVGDRAGTRVHGRLRDRPRGRAPPARGRLLHEPRRPAARLRGGADAAGFADRRLVRLLGAPALDRRTHPPARRCAHRVLLRRAQPARRQDRPRRDARPMWSSSPSG